MATRKLIAEVERLITTRVASGRFKAPAIGIVATRCLEILRDQEFDQRALVVVVEREPVLAALVMRTANSASHGSAVTKLDHAILRLGANRLEAVIVEYAAHKIFDAPGRFAASNREIWDHSIAVAHLARALGTCVGRRDTDTHYLAGLLHDIGKPVVASMLVEAEAQVAAGLTTWLDIGVWNRVIDDVHHQVGVMIGKAWRLPAEVISCIGESDFDAADRQSVSNIVRLANAIAKQVGFASTPVDSAQLDATIAMGTGIAGINEAVARKLGETVRDLVGQS